MPCRAFRSGERVSCGRVVDDLALNIDLAPTVADLTGAPVPDRVDVRSLVPLLRGEAPASWRRAFLVEHAAENKVRTYPGLGAMPAVPDALRRGAGAGCRAAEDADVRAVPAVGRAAER